MGEKVNKCDLRAPKLCKSFLEACPLTMADSYTITWPGALVNFLRDTSNFPLLLQLISPKKPACTRSSSISCIFYKACGKSVGQVTWQFLQRVLLHQHCAMCCEISSACFKSRKDKIGGEWVSLLSDNTRWILCLAVKNSWNWLDSSTNRHRTPC